MKAAAWPDGEHSIKGAGALGGFWNWDGRGGGWWKPMGIGARGTQIRGECHQAKIGEFVEGEEFFFFCYQMLKRGDALLQHGVILRLHVLHPRSTKQADESGLIMPLNGIPLIRFYR